MKESKIKNHLEGLVVPSVSMNAHARIVAGRLAVRAERIQSIRLLRRGIGMLVALVALVPAVRQLVSELSQGGFVTYLRLAFSDTGAVWGARSDFLYSLVESFPVMGMALVLAGMVVALVAVRAVARSWSRKAPVLQLS